MEKGEKSRQRIIEESVPVFNTKGYAGTSMRDLMESTGFRKGGIYRHFESKEELAAEAFSFAYAQLKAAYTSVYEADDPADVKLIRFFKSFRKFLMDPPVKGGCPIMNTAIDADHSNKRLRDLARGAAKDWESILENVVQEGIDDGIFPDSVVPRKEARFIIASIEGGILLSKLHHDIEYGMLAAERLIAWVEGLKSST